MKNIHTIALMGPILTPCYAQQQLIPTPVSVETNANSAFCINAQSVLYLTSTSKELLEQAKFAQALLREGTGLTLAIESGDATKAPKNAIVLSLSNTLSEKGEEAYSMTSSPEQLSITAPSRRGFSMVWSASCK